MQCSFCTYLSNKQECGAYLQNGDSVMFDDYYSELATEGGHTTGVWTHSGMQVTIGFN
jgi:hypothetical protein